MLTYNKSHMEIPSWGECYPNKFEVTLDPRFQTLNSSAIAKELCDGNDERNSVFGRF